MRPRSLANDITRAKTVQARSALRGVAIILSRQDLNSPRTRLSASAAIDVVGSDSDNLIIGNSGANIIEGAGGADIIDGGGGTDKVTYVGSAKGISVSLATGEGSGGDAEDDVLLNVENIVGSDHDDTIEGDGAANVLDGGSRIDTISYQHASAAVTVNLGTTSAQATGGAGSDTISNFESLSGSAYNDVLTGTSGAPLSALCAVELRSPRPLSIDGFRSFNGSYADTLRDWGLVTGDINAVARSNVAPVLNPPDVPSFLAFALTVPAKGTAKSFVVAGSSEWPEGGRFPEDIVRYRDTSQSAMQEKAAYVLSAMERRMRALGSTWADSTMTQSYSAFDVSDFLRNEVAPRCGGTGVVVHYCRPPVEGWDYEMDVKGTSRTELVEI